MIWRASTRQTTRSNTSRETLQLSYEKSRSEKGNGLWLQYRTNCRFGNKSRYSQYPAFYLAEQAVGANPAASFCFLKLVLVTKGSVRFCGSSTMVVTTNQGSPLRST